jgi:hypothetical protein
MLKQKPLAAAVNRKNEAGTSGFILQGFRENTTSGDLQPCYDNEPS